MSDLLLSPISSPDASRDCVIDLSNSMETAEVLTGTITVTSSASSIVTATASANTVALLTDRGRTIAIGKGIQFRVVTHVEETETCYLYFAWTGDSGSADRHRVTVPVVPYITS